LSLNVGELSAVLGLDTAAFDTKLAGAGGKFGPLLKGAGLAAVGIGAAMIGGAALSLNAFKNFETGMNEVFTLLPGISDGAMGQMNDQVKSFSTEFGVLPDKVIPALYQSLSKGVPADNVFTFLETAQKAARGGAVELETAVDGITSTVNAYGASTLSAEQASDLMFTAVTKGGTTFEELSKSLFNVNPVAASLGVQFGDVTAALAAMTAQGVPTSVATTQLRQMFVELGDSSTEVGEKFQQVSGQSFKDFIAGGGNVQDALKLLEASASESGVGLNELFGSVEAGSAALALTGSGGDRFSQMLDAMANSAGATDQAFGKMSEGLQVQVDKIKANVTVLGIEIGEKLAPAAEAATSAVVAAFAKLDNFIQGFSAGGLEGGLATLMDPGQVETIMGIIETVRGHIEAFVDKVQAAWNNPAVQAAIDVFVSNVKDAAEQFRPIIDNIIEIFQNMKPAFEGAAIVIGAIVMVAFALLGVAINIIALALRGLTEVWLVVSAVVGTVYGALLAFAGWLIGVFQNLPAALGAAWSAFTGVLSAVWAFIVALITAHVQMVLAIVSGAWGVVTAVTGAVWSAITSIIGAAWGFITGLVSGAISAVSGVISAGWNAAVGIISGAMGAISGVISGAWNGIVGAVSGAVGSMIGVVSGIPGQVTGALGDLGSLLYDSGTRIIQGLIDGITGMLGSLGDTMSGVASTVTDHLPFSPAKTGPLSGKGNPFYSGQSIINLLGAGIAKSKGNLGGVLADVTGQIGAALGGGPGGGLKLAAAVSGAGVAGGASGSAGGDPNGGRLEIAVKVDEGRLDNLITVTVDDRLEALGQEAAAEQGATLTRYRVKRS